jgi:hypothetical protein
MTRERMLLMLAIAGIFTAALSALDLVPRVRAVEVVILFASAFGSGAAFVGAVIEYRNARARHPHRKPAS